MQDGVSVMEREGGRGRRACGRGVSVHGTGDCRHPDGNASAFNRNFLDFFFLCLVLRTRDTGRCARATGGAGCVLGGVLTAKQLLATAASSPVPFSSQDCFSFAAASSRQSPP